MSDLLGTFIRETESSTDVLKVIEAFQDLAIDAVGAKLFTLTTVNPQEGVARRVYSNMPDAYPVSGTKPMREDVWSNHVLKEHNTFIANTIDDIAKVFPDHELIKSLGCESVLNLPIVLAGKALGTVNFLHEAGFYDESKKQQAEQLKESALICFMLATYVPGFKEINDA